MEHSMSVVMTRCPATGRPVSTGIDTNSVVVDSLPDVGIRMRCPACGGEHMWRKRDTWLNHNVAPDQEADTAA
jgi:hypothetical protein